MKLLRCHRPRPITDRIRMFRQQMPESAHSHLLIATTYMFIQKIKANLGALGGKRVRFKRFAGPQLILLNLLLAQQAVPKPVCDRIRMVRHQVAEPADMSTLHSVTSVHHRAMQSLPALVHVLEAQVPSWNRVGVVLAGRQREIAAVRASAAGRGGASMEKRRLRAARALRRSLDRRVQRIGLIGLIQLVRLANVSRLVRLTNVSRLVRLANVSWLIRLTHGGGGVLG